MNKLTTFCLLVFFMLVLTDIANAKKYCVNATTLRIRAAASVKSSIKGCLHRGDTVDVLNLSEDQQWGEIQRPKHGWVSMEYLYAVEPVLSELEVDEDAVKDWIVEQLWFKIIRIIFLIAAGIEIVFFLFLYKRLDVSIFKIDFGVTALGLLFLMPDDTEFVYTLPFCMTTLVYYPMLFLEWDREDNFKRTSLILLISVIVFLIMLFVVSRVLDFPIKWFLHNTLVVCGCNVLLFLIFDFKILGRVFSIG